MKDPMTDPKMKLPETQNPAAPGKTHPKASEENPLFLRFRPGEEGIISFAGR
jgi:hypothetical protein